MPKVIAEGVTLYSRGEWGAKGQYNTALGTVNKDIWHHFWRPDVPTSASVAEEMAVMRGVEAFHISKGWRRISYNFVIFKSGRVYEGCGLNQMGAHTVGQNSVAKAVCFGYDGDAHGMTAQALRAARAIRNHMIAKGALTRGTRIFGHRDFAAKSCPGNKIYPFLPVITKSVPIPSEDEDMITPYSPEYVVVNFQKVLNKILEDEGLSVTRGEETKEQIAADGDWGPWTNSAWKAVAKARKNVVYVNRQCSGHDWLELRIRYHNLSPIHS